MRILLFVTFFIIFFTITIDIDSYLSYLGILAPFAVISVAFLSRIGWLIEDFWANYLKVILFYELSSR